MYRNQVAAAYLSLYFFIFLFYSGTVWCTKLKHGRHGDNELMYRVYWNQAVASYLSLYFFIFLSLQFSNIKKKFFTFFSGTVRHRKLKLNTKMKSGSVYRVNWNQAAHTYSSYYFFIFLSFQFSVTNLSFR